MPPIVNGRTETIEEIKKINRYAKRSTLIESASKINSTQINWANCTKAESENDFQKTGSAKLKYFLFKNQNTTIASRLKIPIGISF